MHWPAVRAEFIKLAGGKRGFRIATEKRQKASRRGLDAAEHNFPDGFSVPVGEKSPRKCRHTGRTFPPWVAIPSCAAAWLSSWNCGSALRARLSSRKLGPSMHKDCVSRNKEFQTTVMCRHSCFMELAPWQCKHLHFQPFGLTSFGRPLKRTPQPPPTPPQHPVSTRN